MLGSDQRIPVLEALKAHTLHAAYQLFMEGETGSIECGKSADLVWLDRNPLAVAPERIHEISVRGTWLRGQATYSA